MYAGIQNLLERREISNWMPAFAGMTGKILIPKVSCLNWGALFKEPFFQSDGATMLYKGDFLQIVQGSGK